MTQPRRILSFVVFAAAVLLLPGKAAAQNSVTPTLKPTRPGQLIVVNNSPGDQTDPHVSGDLVSYSNSDGTHFTVRYFNLATGVDTVVACIHVVRRGDDDRQFRAELARKNSESFA